MVLRRASHAGSWYPGNKKSLEAELSKYYADELFGPGELPQTLNLNTRTIIGGISPHAGYQYSCSCAAFTYLNLFKEKVPDTIIIIGNDHLGFDFVALMEEGEWETPLGNLEIDRELSNRILETSNDIGSKTSAFTGSSLQEHNIEIQLPLIKYCAKDAEVKIVPIKIGYHRRKDYSLFERLSADLATAINSSEKDIIIVASSDMTHRALKDVHEDYELFRKKDRDVIEGVVELDPERTFKSTSGSVCGIATITTMLLTCKRLNATRGQLLKYYTSYQKTNDPSYVVGYFSGIVLK